MTPLKTALLAVLIVALGLIASVRLGNASTFLGHAVASRSMCGAWVAGAEASIGADGAVAHGRRPQDRPICR